MKHIITVLISVLSFFLLQYCCVNKSSAPILVLATHDEFGTYITEILKTEGFNEFVLDSLFVRDPDHLTLQGYDYVLLAECSVDVSLKKQIEKYIRSGGNIIAFKPDTSLSEIFGIKRVTGELSEGYIGIDPECETGTGLTTKKMQFHGSADLYTVNGAKAVAYLYADTLPETKYPAVVINRYRKSHAIAFTYNLPKSIVYTRQGNPLHAGIEKDGIPGLRGMDLFTDNWIDTSLNTVNQADQQMALLTNCIQGINTYTGPLPRLWYFPDTLKSLVVLDNDGEESFEADLEPQFRDVDSMGARMTLYIKDVDKVSKEWVSKWTARGFEISGHPDNTWQAGNPDWYSMDSAITQKKNEMYTNYGLPMHTVVNHWFVWCGTDADGQQDFGAQAMLEEKHGIEMDANYALYDLNSNQPEFYLGTPGNSQGNYNGSGLVMKYAGATGRTINVYQRLNVVYDQQYMEGGTQVAFFECFKGLLDRSLTDDIYSIVSIKAHNNEYHFSKEPLMNMLAYANIQGIPVWTALELLNFLKMKDEAVFNDVHWKNNQLSFSLYSILTHPNALTIMVPAGYNGSSVTQIYVNNRRKHFDLKLIKGVNYAFVGVPGGTNYEFSVEYKE